MNKSSRYTERFAALVILAALLFNPPILSIFSAPHFVFGIPLLYFYLFVAWGLIIAVNAIISDKLSRENKDIEDADQVEPDA